MGVLSILAGLRKTAVCVQKELAEIATACADAAKALDEGKADSVPLHEITIPSEGWEKDSSGNYRLNMDIPGLTDSKKLTDKKRRELFPVIQEQAIAWGIGMASCEEIDEINILQATFLAMQRALEQLNVRPDLVLIDGNRAKDFGLPVKTVIKGDSLSMNIAAASVLAKVTRDDWMIRMAQNYPQYAFDIHKGYGTKAHYAALTEFGPCPIHRKTFLKKFYGEK